MAREVSVLFFRLWSGQRLFHSDVVELRVIQLVLIILKQILFSQVSRLSPSRLQLSTHLFQASELNVFLYNGVVLREPQS